jgi:hypothetical protein
MELFFFSSFSFRVQGPGKQGRAKGRLRFLGQVSNLEGRTTLGTVFLRIAQKGREPFFFFFVTTHTRSKFAAMAPYKKGGENENMYSKVLGLF